jgi:hypothetical protein
MGTRGAPGAALRRAAGAKKIIQSSVSELLGPMFFSDSELRGHTASSELSCARRRVLEPMGHMPALELG